MSDNIKDDWSVVVDEDGSYMVVSESLGLVCDLDVFTSGDKERAELIASAPALAKERDQERRLFNRAITDICNAQELACAPEGESIVATVRRLIHECSEMSKAYLDESDKVNETRGDSVGGIPPVPYDEHERALTKELEERDYWHDKATELANRIGEHFGFDVGEHSNLNCPVQTALDADWPSASEYIESGWKLVPDLPTYGMLEALSGKQGRASEEDHLKYKAMLSAAPLYAKRSAN